MARPWFSFSGGVHPPGFKESTAERSTRRAPIPAKLVVPLSQHLGAPCDPLVAVGERVERGQTIGDVDAMVSAPVHSPVAGTVTLIGPVLTTGGQRVLSVSIEPDEEQDFETFMPIPGKGEDRERIRAAGIVGMGGATFPSVVKLTPPKDTRIEAVILNGCECEPFLTCDHRLMLEKAERVVAGGLHIRRIVGAQKLIVAVEDNKADAAAALRRAAPPDVEVVELPTRYPQGAEKQLIFSLLGREVPHGKLPAAAGAIVHNVATAAAIADALDEGKPLMERIVTVTGAVAEPGNYLVPVGTLVSDLLEAAGGLVGEVERVIAGGPMTGQALGSLDVPVTKGTSGVVALTKDIAAPRVDDDQACMRCGRCSEACPMRLEPYMLATYSYRRMWDQAADRSVLDCIECGACSYVCPTKRPLLQLIRQAKSAALAKGAR